MAWRNELSILPPAVSGPPMTPATESAGKRHRGVFAGLTFRGRLAFLLLLTMASTSAVLFWTYHRQEGRVRAYVATITSDLNTINQLATYQQQLPQKGDPDLALQAYRDKLTEAGLKETVDAASPSGEVVASTDPKRLGKKVRLGKKRRDEQPPFRLSASLPDTNLDPNGQTTYSVEFPIVRDNKVIGYLVLHGVVDEVEGLLHHTDMVRSVWVIVTLLTGMFFIAFLAFQFTRPISKLVNATTRVAQGDLTVSLPDSGSDEMGRLARTFNEMVARLRESRQLQERLSEAEKLSLLGRFAGTVAHEVRNSLNFINLSIDQTRAKHLGVGTARAREIERNLARVKDEVLRLNHLVNDFLAAGRQSPPELAPCDIGTVIEEAVAMVEKQAHTQAISLSIDLPPALPHLQADARQMKTCFLNILTNAVQAMPRGGHIGVSASLLASNGNANPGRLQLCFSDTGPGIPPEDRERIFAPYFSTKATGFGLGLAITRKIVEEHGGRISATEAGTGGTLMVVELPLELAAPAVERSGAPQELVRT
ncbi:MAG TPA: ATP-binding protein [Terriglobia bacterium]|nr:ATP-binding protein [Terriglobia bacterium]